MDKLCEIVNNIVSEVLEEELAIASDVSNGVKQLTDALVREYRNGSGIEEKEAFRDNESGFNVILSIKVITVKEELNIIGTIYLTAKIVRFKNYESFDRYWHAVDVINSVNDNSINCTMFSINDALDIGTLRNVLQHELEHKYQMVKSGKDIVGKEYHKAKMILLRKDKYHNKPAYTYVSYVFYYLQSAEINANVNGLYGELIGRKEKIMDRDVRDSVRNTVFYDEYNSVFLPYYRYVIDNLGNKDIVEAVNYLGFSTTGMFMKYVNKQRKYLNDKFMKVIQKINNDIRESVDLKKINISKVKPSRFSFIGG